MRHAMAAASVSVRMALLEVAARHECLVACALDDERARPFRSVQRLVEPVHGVHRDRVARVRPVDRDDRQTVVHFEVDHGTLH
jgi:hypothetical protein